MTPITVTVGPLASAAANNICLSQTPGAAGALTLNGALVVSGVAVLDTPRRVLITAAADESSHTFTIAGTNWSGNSITETITGPNATTAQSVLDYATVTSIKISAAATGALTVGTNGVASSAWVRLDPWSNSYTSIQCNVSGTVNYTIQATLDNPDSPMSSTTAANVTWVNSSDTNVVNATTTQQSNFGFVPIFARVLLNSGTGTVTTRFVQSGVVNR